LALAATEKPTISFPDIIRYLNYVLKSFGRSKNNFNDLDRGMNGFPGKLQGLELETVRQYCILLPVRTSIESDQDRWSNGPRMHQQVPRK
jgi:hypothetical protein